MCPLDPLCGKDTCTLPIWTGIQWFLYFKITRGTLKMSYLAGDLIRLILKVQYSETPAFETKLLRYLIIKVILNGSVVK